MESKESAPKTKKERQSNFELLRIICMLLIVTDHFFSHGFWDSFGDPSRNFKAKFGFTASNVIMVACECTGTIAVDIFVMISGYFSCSSGYTARKILQLILQEQFYAILILLVLGISGIVPFKAVTIYRHVLSVMYNTDYWFGYTFVGLMIIGDYVNIVLEKLDKKQTRRLIVMVGLYYCVMPTLANNRNQFWGIDACPWFVYVYVIGAYIRMYSEPLFEKKYRWLILLAFLLLYAVDVLVPMCYQYWPKNDFSSIYELDIGSRDTLTCLLCATLLFIFFKNVDIGAVKAINVAGSTTFAIYLLHENQQMREVIWVKIFNVTKYYEPAWRLVLQVLLVVAIVFVVALVVDLARQYLFEKPVFKFLDWLEAKWGKEGGEEKEGKRGGKKGTRGNEEGKGVEGEESGGGGGGAGGVGINDNDGDTNLNDPLLSAEEGRQGYNYVGK